MALSRRGPILVASLAAIVLGAVITWNQVHTRSLETEESRIRTLLDEGALVEALPAAEALRAREPKSPVPHLLVGEILASQRQNDPAVESFLRAWRLDPASVFFPDLVYYMAFARTGSFPQDEKRLVETLAEQENRLPNDQSLPETRVVITSALLNSRDCPENERSERIARLTSEVAAFHPGPSSRSTSWYHLSEALLLLHRNDEAMVAMRKGVEAASQSDTWERLTQLVTLAFLELHAGQLEAARADMMRYPEILLGWRSLHHGMLLPTLEYIELTLRVRFGETWPLPDGYDALVERAQRAGVLEQYGSTELRRALRALVAAIDHADRARSEALVSDLMKVLIRDTGCISENAVIRPHLLSMLLAARGQALEADGDRAKASVAWQEAARIFPEDSWLSKNALRVASP
jgi:tetratricopeptide (TPR) repeat protein